MTSFDKVDWLAELALEMGSTGTLNVTRPFPLATVVNLKWLMFSSQTLN